MTRARMVPRAAPASGVALVAAGAAMWGADGALRAPLVTHWSGWTIVLYEHVILAALVLPGLIRRRAAVAAIPARTWPLIAGVAWGGSALATLAFTFAFTSGNPDVVVLLQKSQPLWAVLTAAALLGERPRARLLPVGVIALAGTYLLSFGAANPAHALAGGQGRAALLALAAAALWGAATALGRDALSEVSPSVLTGLRFALALPVLALIAATQAALSPAQTSPVDWLRLIVLAVVSGLLGMTLYYRGLRSVPASIATFAELAFPATALLVNHVVLGATIDTVQLAGFAMLWAAIAVVHRVPVMVPEPATRVAMRAP